MANGDKSKEKKKKKQKNGQLEKDTTVEAANGDAADQLPASKAASGRKAGKKEKRAKAKAAARALDAAQTSAVAVDAPTPGGSVGADGAAEGPRPSKKVKLAQRSSTSTAFAAVGSKELAALGAHLQWA